MPQFTLHTPILPKKNPRDARLPASFDIIQRILRDSHHHLTLFTDDEISAFHRGIFTKHYRGKETPYVRCVVRDKDVQLTPEEIVRQLYAARLMRGYGYPKKRLTFECPVSFGSSTKKVDIAISDRSRPDIAYIIVELKKPKFREGKSQLRSYCNATGAPIGIWTNGEQISHYHRRDPNYFEEITDIPKADQSLRDILSERYTLKDLILNDKLFSERKTLKDIILELEDDVLANAGEDVFEEVFKLIFTKLFDEYLSRNDSDHVNFYAQQSPQLPGTEADGHGLIRETMATISDDRFRVLEFRNTGQTETELKAKIQRLFDEAKAHWPGVFHEGEGFNLSPGHLAVCVSSLQDVKLFNSNLLVIDEAFEYLVSKSAKGEKGQYFTPRHVIDMCVQMLNPKAGEFMIDTASGSCGFPVHTIFKLTGHLFGSTSVSEADKRNVLKVFGIDFDEKVVRVARTLNLIAGDGETNVLHLNTLDFDRWSDRTEKDHKWINTYGRGFDRLSRLRVDRGQNKQYGFDILMANPPFAGDIKESRILHQYELAFQSNGKPHPSVGRDILFIERNLDFLKPGGRIAIVLPQGRFNNASDKRIRAFISQRARILAVVGLHSNTFKPHTGTKTSVLFLQKWNDNPALGPLCPKVDDYPIFFAVSERGGKDNSGNYIHVRETHGQYLLDPNGHIVVDHDLHNHGGTLPDGIAESFINWAKAEQLSFWID